MAFSKSTRILAIVPEVTPGTTPTNPAYLTLEAHETSGMNATNEWLASKAIKANKAAPKGRKVKDTTSGTLDVDFKRDDSVDVLLASAFGGTWTETGTVGKAGDTLKAGITDSFFTVKEIEVDGATKHHFVSPGCKATEFTISAEASQNEGLKASFKVEGYVSQARATSETGTPTYPAGNTFLPLGPENVVVTIAGATIDYSSLEFSISTPHEKEFKLGSASARGMSVGNRVIKLSGKSYRGSTLAFDTLADSNNGVLVTIAYGVGSENYTITVHAAQFVTRTVNETQGESRMIAWELQASDDVTAGTDCTLTRG